MTREQQIAYWKRNLCYVLAVLAAWFLVSCGAAVLLADPLDAYRLGGFPLGFWFAQQGAIVAFVVLVAVYVKLMNALDHRHGVFEDE